MTQVLDMEVVEELLTLMGDEDPELLLDLIDMFQKDGPERVDKIEAAFAAGDYETLSEVAHSLKGSSGNLGVLNLQDSCDVLQVAGKKGDQATITAGMSSLRKHLDDGLSALSEIQAKYG